MSHEQALAALADPTRRSAFELLKTGPMSVGDIADRMPVSRPAISQHLKILKEAGLVKERPDGARRLYFMHPQGVAELRAYLDRMWDDALESYKRIADDLADRARDDRDPPDEEFNAAYLEH